MFCFKSIFTSFSEPKIYSTTTTEWYVLLPK